jgi:hypothetical protein
MVSNTSFKYISKRSIGLYYNCHSWEANYSAYSSLKICYFAVHPLKGMMEGIHFLIRRIGYTSGYDAAFWLY